MAMPRKIKVEFGEVFPFGVYAVSEVTALRDFDRSTAERPVQAVDEDSGLLVWTVDVVDADPEARKSNRHFTVKIAAPVQPVLPARLRSQRVCRLCRWSSPASLVSPGWMSPGCARSWRGRSGRPGWSRRSSAAGRHRFLTRRRHDRRPAGSRRRVASVEACVCGRPAVLVYVHSCGVAFGYCGLPDGPSGLEPCPSCGAPKLDPHTVAVVPATSRVAGGLP
jgi:hypothetical protein